MTFFHRWFGLALAVAFLALGVWGIVAWARDRDPGARFWKLLAAAQAGVAVQAIGGVLVFALGGPRGSGMHWLHYAYGAFPAVVLIAAHRLSRRFEGLAWAVFAFAGLICFGLLLRGYMTGFGR